MDPRRLRIGEWLLGAGGVFLLGVTFLNWYGVDGIEFELSAWEVYTVLDVFLALIAALAIGAAVMAAAHNTPAAALALASLTALLGLVGLVVLGVRTAAPPGFEAFGPVTDPGGSGDTTLLAGHWLGLGAMVLTTLAAFAAMRDERFPRAARIEVPVETIPPPEGGKA